MGQNWVPIVENSVGDKFYVDINEIRKEGNLVRFFEINDFGNPIASGDRSVRIFREVDCTAKKRRIIQITYFTGSMLTGLNTGTELGEGLWQPTTAGSTADIILNFVCGR